ncbi:ATP synthase F1 subcomplex gamma subunit [Desulfurobacterium pacificum]|uniref:ATP synthase gamma chain n=1 Tax=Desulfurobacterium pacificum TaxID=240166 RepID=A0ABY1NII0_9BACT|nr:ATP synthase F1 subunit gamma [Desulfurobacterium pacificum]SMP10677.1 ATP synthase F1 subcomplex gamma subunit [Desulfurobacterium pacificum]
MPGMREIKAKIKSLKGTKRITAAMKAVSAAKLRKAQVDLFNVRPYAEVMKGMVEGLYLRENPAIHSIFRVRPVKRIEFVVVSSDKGLCGAFNANIIRTVNKLAREKKEQGIDISLTTVGNKASQFFTKYSDLHVRKEVRDIFRRIGLPLANEIAEDLYLGYISEYFDEVYIIYNRFVNALTQEVTVERVLPLTTEVEEGTPIAEYTVGPDESVVERAVKSYVSAAVLRALKESETSEHAARMTAMDNATKNAEDLIKKLTISFNKARQAAITKELIEITTAIEAMK